MSFPRWKKVVALALAALCSAANFCLAVSLYHLWRSSKRDAQQLGESEWEGLANAWVRSINALGGLTVFYFLTAALANAIGFVGMLKRSPRFVRLWRDFAIADLACTTTAVVAGVYASSRYMDLRNNLCEELSRHDDMMMDLAEMGITLENCEQWSQRVVFAVIFFLFIVQLVRLYLVFTTSSVFARMSPHMHHVRRPSCMKRIYIMPGRPNSTVQHQHKSDEPVVYMPIPLSELTERERQRVSAREAWIATSEPSTPRSTSNPRGPIVLPIQPGEGLLPVRREK